MSPFSPQQRAGHPAQDPLSLGVAERARQPPGARLAAVGHALAPYRYTQREIVDALRTMWMRQHHNARRIDRLHQAVHVGARHFALPLEQILTLDGFGEANDAFIEVGTALGAEAVGAALEAAGLEPEHVDALYFTTVTGLAVPTIDARLVARLGLRRDVRRIPMFGLGCVGGAAGVARVDDFLRGAPGGVAVLLSVELCSLTLQRDDFSIANLIATGLFADGAAAVVAVGADHERATTVADDDSHRGQSHTGLERVAAVAPRATPQVLATRSVFWDDTEHIMGWSIRDSGFEIVLSAELPALIHASLEPEVCAFLAEHALELSDIDVWLCHPGGPKVLRAVEGALQLPDDALAASWDSLERIGNLSSASVLMILEETLSRRPPTGRGRALLLAMGPGFCAEMVLLTW